MNDQDVRDMLRRRADDVQVSPDAFARIQDRIAGDAPVGVAVRAPARRWSSVVVAAAAVVAVALVTVVLVGGDDDPVDVEVGPAASVPRTEPAPAVGVWPWPGDEVDDAALDDPDETAAAYIDATVGRSAGTELSAFQQGDSSSGEIVVSGDLETRILLRRNGRQWYVASALSDLIAMQGAPGGSVHYEVGADGSLQHWSQAVGHAEQQDQPRSVERGDGGDIPAADRVTRHRLLLATGEETSPPSEFGVAHLTEIVVAPTDTEPVLGIWPWPGDVVDEQVALGDPVDVARAYVASRSTDPDATWTGSEFLQGDNNSGEVNVTGDIETTVLLRRDGGRWYVEAAIHHSFYAQPSDDGSLLVGSDDAGTLTHTYRTPQGSQELERRELTAGREIEIGPPPPGDAPASHQLTIETATGTTRLIEIRAVETSFTRSAAPDDAVDPQSGLDPREVARDYLRRRLGGEVEVRDFVGDGERGTVDWSGGVVQLRLHDGSWYVVGATSDLVRLDSVEARDGQLELEVSFAGGASITVSAHDADGGDCGTEVTNNHAAGAYRSVLELQCDPETIRALYRENDTGVLAITELPV